MATTKKDLAVYASIILGAFGLIQQYLALQQTKAEQAAHERYIATMGGRNYRAWATNAPAVKR